MKLRLVLLLIACLGLGCQASYTVGVNGYSSAGRSLQIPDGSSIRVVADSNGPNPILQKEIGAKVESILTEKGYGVKADWPDYYLRFEYGIDSGRTVTEFMPVWYSGGYYDYRWHGHRHLYVAHVPYYEVVYTRWLVLRLFAGEDYRASSKAEPLWIGEVTSAGMDSDLRNLVNYMLVAGFEHFGRDTGRMITEVISKDDERVLALR